MPKLTLTTQDLLPADEVFSALIFDCDGTLVDTAPSHLHAFNRALSLNGLEMSPDFYRARFGLSPAALLAEFSEAEGVAIDANQIVEEYSKAFQSDLSRLREIPLIANVARAHQGRTPMAVASNGTRENVQRTLAAVGLQGLFDLVVAIDDVKEGKPAPDLYLEAARRLNVSPGDCIVFEDTDEGLQAASSAGMRTRDIRAYVQADE